MFCFVFSIFQIKFIVALSSATGHGNQGAWNVNTEYHYKLNTKTVTALPNLKNQWSGLFTRADLTIRLKSNNVLIGKVQNGEYAEYNHELTPEQQQHQHQQYEQFEHLNYQQFEDLNTKPFEIRLRNNAIHSIAVDETMTNTQLNQLKGIISQLQVDLAAQNAIPYKYNQLPETNGYNQAVFKVMEPTVTGKCETLYDVAPLPEHIAQSYPEYNRDYVQQPNEYFYEVTKTRNYSNCDQRLGYHFGISGSNDWQPNTNSMGDLFKSAVSRIVISGTYDNYIIHSTKTVNRVVKQHFGNFCFFSQVIGN